MTIHHSLLTFTAHDIFFFKKIIIPGRGFFRLIRNSYDELLEQNTNMRELFRKYLDNNCSPDEVRKLLAYFNIDDNESILRRLITEWLEENEEDEEENQLPDNFLGSGDLSKSK